MTVQKITGDQPCRRLHSHGKCCLLCLIKMIGFVPTLSQGARWKPSSNGAGSTSLV